MFIERAALMRILEAEAADVPNDVNDTEPGMRTYGSLRLGTCQVLKIVSAYFDWSTEDGLRNWVGKIDARLNTAISPTGMRRPWCLLASILDLQPHPRLHSPP